MGLDMYLYADYYLSGWEHTQDHKKGQVAQALAPVGLTTENLAEGSPHAMISVCVAYWRKANAIHSWLVANVQDDVDDCNRYYVSPDKLLELRTVAQAAAESYDAGDREQAEKILTPKSGFFFGSVDVDESYRDDLQLTIEQIDEIVANPSLDPKKCMLYYQASW